MNPIIQQFIESSPLQRKLMIKAGFELETQSTSGLDSDSIGEIDYDSANEAIYEQVDEVIGSDLSNYITERLYDQVRDAVFSHISDDFDYSDYTGSASDDLQSEIDRKINQVWSKIKQKIDPPEIEVDKDGSVSGFEFRTVDGLNYKQFIIASRAVFSMRHKIDDECSFHIHLSIPGIQHSYGERFQVALIEYLLENVKRLPTTVQERFKNAPENKYIKGMISSRDKYSFVHAHSQGTWEFRCFGNVKNHRDAMTCLEIAIEAMAYAYKCTKGGQKLIIDSYSGDNQELLHGCLESLKPLSTALRSLEHKEIRQWLKEIAA
jgi:hypothetical protein